MRKNQVQEPGSGMLQPSGLWILILTGVLLTISSSGGQESKVQPPTKVKIKQKNDPAGSQLVTHDGATLVIGNAALNGDFDLETQSLEARELPRLDPGLTNVTRGPRSGYRMLPHGMKFKKDISITLPFDPTQVPAGSGPEDVRTYFFDEGAGQWTALPTVRVDMTAGTVTSLTSHFTDFINGVITLPDQPGVASFNPTDMKELLSMSPGAGIPLIAPPVPNHTGSNSLSYPIEVPPGRLGMQPQISLNYSSSGGNGWLGLGWDLGQGGIGIDTRWGVPRYDPALETETYTLGGEQLAPLAHRGTPQARQMEKTFRRRVEGKFERIIRHGDHPSRYWWEVTEKNGQRRFYGGDPETGGPLAGATLADDGGNVYFWALRETRDTFGNSVRFRYAPVQDAGVAGGTVPGREIYLSTISYTGRGAQDGPYRVNFLRDRDLGEPRRPDVSIDCKGGFKRVSADLLRRIEVSYNGLLIRRYEFRYTEGAFRKSLLSAVIQYGEDGTSEFHRHTFEYFDDVRGNDGRYQGFGAATTWDAGNDSVTAGLLGQGEASALSGAVTKTFGGHIFLGLNVNQPTKNGAAGFKVGYQRSKSEGVLALIDVNGDGLPDKVFKSGGGYFCRLNQSGPNGTTSFGPPRPLPTLPAITRDNGTTTSFGGELYFFANVFANTASTYNRSSAYFTDANGDGFIDVVRDGVIYFGYLDAQGNPAWSPDSSVTPAPVGPGAVDATELVEDFEAVFQEQVDLYPLADTLRRWVAPFDGTIRITAPVKLLQDASPDRTDYTTADGVRTAIQLNGAELWFTSIDGNDYAEKAPTNVDAVPVQRGDRLYFRVQSKFDGAFDQVSWNPEIAYTGLGSALDVNALNVYRYKASEDFTLAGRRGVFTTVPVQGTVRLKGDFKKKGKTSDDVTVIVSKNGTDLLRATLAWDQVGAVPINQDFTVAAQDKIQLRVKIDSNVDLSQLEWVPSLFYIDAPGIGQITDDQGNFLLQLNPPYDFDFYPQNELTAPQEAWTVTQTGTLTVLPNVQLTQNAQNASGDVVLTIKLPGKLVAKKVITFANGQTQNNAFTVDVTQGDKLYFDYSSYNPEFSPNLTNRTVRGVFGDPQVNPSFPLPTGFHSEVVHGLFPGAYRGWGVAGYNGNRERAALPIQEDLLVFNQDDWQAPDAQKRVKAYLFNPLPASCQWRGPDDLTWAASDRISSSRLGLDFIEVPRPQQFAGGRAVTRLSRTTQTAVGAGVSLLSGSASNGKSEGLVEFIDLNGDKFPDVIGNGRVQYSTLSGGLEGANRPVAGLSKVRRSESQSKNFGVGGGPTFNTADSQGRVPAGGGPPKSGDLSTQMVCLGLSGNLGSGEGHGREDLIDVNGDGLPDRVSSDGSSITVAFNLGYGFAAPEPWGAAAMNESKSQTVTVGGTLGFNGGIYDFSGGLSLTKTTSETDKILMDVNGDGLLDRVRPSGNSLLVAFNTGSGFAPEVEWTGTLGKGVARNGDSGLGGGLYFTIGIGPLIVPADLLFIIINPGADFAQVMGRQEVTLKDIDGDGEPDYVFSEDNRNLVVARNMTGKTNLLKTVRRPLGAVMNFDYSRVGNTSSHPQSRWVLSRSTVDDGHPGDGVDVQVKKFAYEDGRYDRSERAFLGFARVIEDVVDPTLGEALYRRSTHEYLNGNVYTIGLPFRETLTDAQGKLQTQTETTYLLRDVSTGLEPADPASRTAILFPMRSRSDLRYFEGQAQPLKFTQVTNTYDAVGNIIRWTDAGDVGADDDVVAEMSYASFQGPYIVNKPTSLKVSGNGRLMRRRETSVDPATGALTEIRAFLENGQVSVSTLDHYPDGTLRSVIGPPNQRGQRFAVSYEYEATTGAHVARAQDSFGYASTSQYNLKHGKKTRVTDSNQNVMQFNYDGFGRMASVTAPNELEGPGPTVTFEYHPEATPAWAMSRHLDRFRGAGATIDTLQFIDGLVRTIQTKKTATVHVSPTAPAVDVWIVSGHAEYDFVGREILRSYPVTEPIGPLGVFNPGIDSLPPTRSEYDVVDRLIRATSPDGTFVEYQYGVDPDRDGIPRFSKTTIDPLRNRTVIFTDIRGLSRAGLAYLGQRPIWQSQYFDSVKQLVAVKDDLGNLTTLEYDLQGRTTAVNSPDKGRTEQSYDLAGNVVSRSTSNLRAMGKFITYEYDFNRKSRTIYPNLPSNNVTLEYGPPGAPFNRAGRIQKVTDGSGVVERSYGRMGEVVEEKRFLPGLDVPGNDPARQTFVTKYTYDSFQRLRQLIYPDGETVTYNHDSSGSVREVRGVKEGREAVYAARLEYDKFGQKAYRLLGNGIGTTFAYDSRNRRLSQISSAKPSLAPFQDNRYAYDAAGNLLQLTSPVPVPSNALGGPAQQSFLYDSLYRMVHAEGSFSGDHQGLTSSVYALDVDYDTINNLSRKSQTCRVNAKVDKPTSYEWSYQYGGVHPHAPTRVGERDFAYDADGNQVSYDGKDDGGPPGGGQGRRQRTIAWDEEDRMISVADQGNSAQSANSTSFVYDYNHQRVLKRSSDHTTAYVNGYFSVRNRNRQNLITKHIIVGGLRIASNAFSVPLDANNAPKQDGFLYYYHPDQLGSAQFVSDRDGNLRQHVEYFPFGESWVTQTRDNSDQISDIAYLFAGKELDKETALYYFGARYYDARTSVWQSADPAISTFGPGQTPDASMLAGHFTYTQGRPTRMIDPDGRHEKDVHFFETYYLARRAGFSPQEARWLAVGNQGMDETSMDTVNPLRRGLTSLLNPITGPITVGVVAPTAGILLLVGLVIPQAKELAVDLISWFTGWTLPESTHETHFPAKSINSKVEFDSPYARKRVESYFTTPGMGRDEVSLLYLGGGFHTYDDSDPHEGYTAIPGHGARHVDDPSINPPRQFDRARVKFGYMTRALGAERDLDAVTINNLTRFYGEKDFNKRIDIIRNTPEGSELHRPEDLDLTAEEKRTLEEKVNPRLRAVRIYEE